MRSPSVLLPDVAGGLFRGVYSTCPVRSVDVPGLVGLHNHVAEAGVSLGGLDFRRSGGQLPDRRLKRRRRGSPERHREVVAVHHGKLLLQEVLAAVCVMHEHIVEGVAVLSGQSRP